MEGGIDIGRKDGRMDGWGGGGVCLEGDDGAFGPGCGKGSEAM